MAARFPCTTKYIPPHPLSRPSIISRTDCLVASRARFSTCSPQLSFPLLSVYARSSELPVCPGKVLSRFLVRLSRFFQNMGAAKDTDSIQVLLPKFRQLDAPSLWQSIRKPISDESTRTLRAMSEFELAKIRTRAQAVAPDAQVSAVLVTQFAMCFAHDHDR